MIEDEQFSPARMADRMEIQGRWRIFRRVSFGDSVAHVHLADMGGILAHPGWAHGTRDANDPSMMLRRELGL